MLHTLLQFEVKETIKETFLSAVPELVKGMPHNARGKHAHALAFIGLLRMSAGQGYMNVGKAVQAISFLKLYDWEHHALLPCLGMLGGSVRLKTVRNVDKFLRAHKTSLKNFRTWAKQKGLDAVTAAQAMSTALLMQECNNVVASDRVAKAMRRLELSTSGLKVVPLDYFRFMPEVVDASAIKLLAELLPFVELEEDGEVWHLSLDGYRFRIELEPEGSDRMAMLSADGKVYDERGRLLMPLLSIIDNGDEELQTVQLISSLGHLLYAMVHEALPLYARASGEVSGKALGYYSYSRITSGRYAWSEDNLYGQNSARKLRVLSTAIPYAAQLELPLENPAAGIVKFRDGGTVETESRTQKGLQIRLRTLAKANELGYSLVPKSNCPFLLTKLFAEEVDSEEFASRATDTLGTKVEVGDVLVNSTKKSKAALRVMLGMAQGYPVIEAGAEATLDEHVEAYAADPNNATGWELMGIEPFPGIVQDNIAVGFPSFSPGISLVLGDGPSVLPHCPVQVHTDLPSVDDGHSVVPLYPADIDAKEGVLRYTFSVHDEDGFVGKYVDAGSVIGHVVDDKGQPILEVKTRAEGVLSQITFKRRTEGNLTRLSVRTTVVQDHRQFKGRSPLLKNMVLGARQEAVLPSDKNPDTLDLPVTMLATADASKWTDLAWNILPLIGDTAVTNEAVANMVRRFMQAEFGEDTSVLTIDPRRVYEGKYEELKEWFVERFKQYLTVRHCCGEQGAFYDVLLSTLKADSSFKEEAAGVFTDGDTEFRFYSIDGKRFVEQQYAALVGDSKRGPLRHVITFEASSVGEAVTSTRQMVGNVRDLSMEDIGEALRMIDRASDRMALWSAFRMMADHKSFNGFERITIGKAKEIAQTVVNDDPSAKWKIQCDLLKDKVIDLGGTTLWLPAVLFINCRINLGVDNNMGTLAFRVLNGIGEHRQNCLRLQGAIKAFADSDVKKVCVGTEAVSLKPVAAPNVPAAAVVTLASPYARSANALMERVGCADGDVYISRAPMTKGIRAKAVTLPYGQNIWPYWVTDEVAVMSSSSNFEHCGDFDGDNGVISPRENDLPLYTTEDGFNFLYEITGVDVADPRHGLYVGDHYNPSAHKKLTKVGLSAKHLMTKAEYISFQAKAAEVLLWTVGKSFNIFYLMDALISFRRGYEQAGLEWTGPEWVPTDPNGSVAASSVYETMLGGYSDPAWDLTLVMKSMARGNEVDIDHVGEILEAMGVNPSFAEVFTLCADEYFAKERYTISQLCCDINNISRGIKKPVNFFVGNAELRQTIDSLRPFSTMAEHVYRVSVSVEGMEKGIIDVKPLIEDDENEGGSKAPVEPKPPVTPKGGAMSSVDTLNEQQRKVYDAVMKGQNVLLTGEPGTGKSYLLGVIATSAIKRGIKVVMTSSTGTSAMNLMNMSEDAKASTWNSATAIRLGAASFLPRGMFEMGSKQKRTRKPLPHGKTNNWVKARFTSQTGERVLVVIDEFPMLPGQALQLGLQAIKDVNPEAQFLIVGDPFQLLPVDGDMPWDEVNWRAGDNVRVDPSPLADLGLQEYHLSDIERTDDPEFIRSLQNLRVGKIDELMASRFGIECDDEAALHVYYNNAEVKQRNAEKLAAFPGKSRKYVAKVTSNYADKNWVKELDPIEEVMELKKGVPFMVRKNLRNLDGDILAGNGTVVTVVELGKDHIVGRREDGIDIKIPMMKLDVPLDGRGREKGSFFQLPGHLAFAITGNKVQGLTVDRPLVVHAYCMWGGRRAPVRTPAWLYVAASRVTELEYLTFADEYPDSASLFEGSAVADAKVLQRFASEAHKGEGIRLEHGVFKHVKQYNETEDAVFHLYAYEPWVASPGKAFQLVVKHKKGDGSAIAARLIGPGGKLLPFNGSDEWINRAVQIHRA